MAANLTRKGKEPNFDATVGDCIPWTMSSAGIAGRNNRFKARTALEEAARRLRRGSEGV